MSLPDRIAVKTSSDAGESSLTRVFVETMEMKALVGQLLGHTGKDAELLQQVLERGSYVRGASRLRWAGLSVTKQEAAGLLADFAGNDASRAFAASRCTGALLLEGRTPVEIPKEAANSRRLFRRKSFWEVLMGCFEEKPPAYVDYSYKLAADRYRRELSLSETTLLKEQAKLLTHDGLAHSVLENDFRSIELFCHR